MALKTIGAAIIAGVVLTTAPLMGIAEETGVSVAVKEQVASADDLVEKVSAVAGGALEQGKALWQNVWGAEERYLRKVDENRKLKERVLQLEDQLVQKQYISGLEYARAAQCVETLAHFFNTQLAPGGGDVK